MGSISAEPTRTSPPTSSSSISGPANLIATTNSLYGIVTDNTALMIAAKYTWEPLRFFGGYEHIRQTNPSNPLGVGATAQGGYLLSGVEDKNLDSPKIVQVWWTGAKYAYDSKTDITLSYYQQLQNDFRVPATCSPSAGFRSSCAGTLNEVSLYADHHFSKRFELYAGIAYSNVSGGLAIAIPHGPGVPYYYDNNLAPTVGARFTF
jgi:predicted porin